MICTTPLTHPLLLFLVNGVLTMATAASTHSQTVRYLALLLSIFLCYLALSNWNQHINTTGWAASILAGVNFSISNILFDRLIHRNWQYGKVDLRPNDIDKKEQECRKHRQQQSRWNWGQEVLVNTRYIGSKHEVSNVPLFDAKDPVLGPSRWIFCLQHAVLIFVLMVLNVLAVDGRLNANRKLLDDEYIPWFGRIFGGGIPQLREEMATRITVSLLYWASQFCLIQCLYSIGALLDVGFGGGDVKLWRPLFGKGRDACTIRGFWGKFWHQCIQLNLKGPAEFTTHTILHIPRHTLLARYIKIFLAFAVSGAMHTAADYGGNILPAQSGAMRFFCTQALGIMFEDGVQEMWKKMGGKKGSLFGRIIGSIWTLGFLCWSSPTWVYPIARKMEKENVMLTLWAMKPLVEGLKLW